MFRSLHKTLQRSIAKGHKRKFMASLSLWLVTVRFGSLNLKSFVSHINCKTSTIVQFSYFQ